MEKNKIISSVLALAKSEEKEWEKLITPPLVLDKNSSPLDALTKLQKRMAHMAIVEEEGKPLGIVTIEDIVEEVLGKIYDEDDTGSLQRILRT